MAASKISRLYVTTVLVDPTEGDWKRVRGRVDMNLNIDKTEIDESHMDTEGGWSIYDQGRKNASIGGSLRYNPEDPGQALLEANSEADGDLLLIRYRAEEGGGHDQRVATGFVSNWNPSKSDESPQDCSFSFRITGAIVKSTQ